MRPRQTSAPPSWTVRTIVAASALVALVACGGDTPDPIAAPAPPSISLRFDLYNEGVWTVRGQSEVWDNVILDRAGGYGGAVTLTIEGLPPGVTATFDPATLYAGTTKSAVTFTAAADAPTEITFVTIRASGVGVRDATTVFRFVVFPPAGA